MHLGHSLGNTCYLTQNICSLHTYIYLKPVGDLWGYRGEKIWDNIQIKKKKTPRHDLEWYTRGDEMKLIRTKEDAKRSRIECDIHICMYFIIIISIKYYNKSILWMSLNGIGCCCCFCLVSYNAIFRPSIEISTARFVDVFARRASINFFICFSYRFGFLLAIFGAAAGRGNNAREGKSWESISHWAIFR